MRGAATAAAVAPQLLRPTLCGTPSRRKGALNYKLNLYFAFCLFLSALSVGEGLVPSRPAASLQPTTAATHGVHASNHNTPSHTPQHTPEAEKHETEHGSKTESSMAERTKGTEGAAGGQQPVHEKPESTAAAAQPAAAAAASTATAAPSPAAASGTGQGPEGSGIESISKEPYEKGMGKLYTEGQHIVQMLQESLRASRGLKSAEDISAKLRGEIVKDVEALRDTLHKEHQNLTLLRKYEREQDALLKAQLGYLMPSGIEETAEGEEEAAEPKAEEAHAVTSAYTSEAAQLPDVSLLVAFFSLFLVLGL